MNLSELQAEIGRLLNDPRNERWAPDVLTDRINDAMAVIQGYTQALKTAETLTPTANQATVNLDADTMDVYRVVITRANGDQFPIEGTYVEDLDYHFPDWRNWSAGDPKTWWYDAGNQQLNLVPKPDSNNAITNGLSVYEIRKPTDLVNSTDIPFDSNNQLVPYHDAIVHFVVAKCWQDDGSPEALAKSKFHMSGSMGSPGQYEGEVQRIIGEFDNPQVPTSIKWQPQGGRIGGWWPTKSNPLGV